MALIFIKHDPATGKRYFQELMADDIADGLITEEMLAFSVGEVVVRGVITRDFSGASQVPNGFPLLSADTDGLTASIGQKWAVIQESDQTLNGIYIVSAGPWARSGDTITAGMQVQVMFGGASYSGALLYCRNTTDPLVDTDAITFGLVEAVPANGSVSSAKIAPGAVTSAAILNSALTLRHLSGSGTAPAIAAGVAAGTGPTVSISGTDMRGVITVTTGTAPSLDDVLATVTFAEVYPSPPGGISLFQANNDAAGRIGQIYIDPDETTTALFKIRVGLAGALTASTTYKFYYLIIG